MEGDPSTGSGQQESVEPAVEDEGPIDPGEVEQPTDLEAESGEDSQPEEAQQPDDDSEEFEWEGKRIRAPKGLKDGVLRQADYTRKTQEVAARARELQERAERIEQQSKATDEELQHRAALHHIDAELKRFDGFDWQQYQIARQNDPLGADEAWNYVQHLRAQRNEAASAISQAESTRNAEAQQATARRLHDTEKYARSKGWGQDVDKAVIDFAMSKGASARDLQQMMNPVVYETLYLARLGEQTLKKGMAAPKAAAPQQAPLHVVGAKSSPPARKSVADMSMDEYVAFRKKQEAAR